MRPIDTALARWLDPAADFGERCRIVADLAELARRHGDFGNHPPYSFHDPALGRAGVRLATAELARIAAGAARVVLDRGEEDSMRTSAAFLLGKTHQKSGLATIATLLAAEADPPPALVRQCAFTFDTLAPLADFAALGINLDRVGDQFDRHGIPWDRARRRVDVNLL